MTYEEAKQALVSCVDCSWCGGCGVRDDAVEVILATTTVETIIRCKDCKHYIKTWKSDENKKYGLCEIHGTADMEDNNFCSYGETRNIGEKGI